VTHLYAFFAALAYVFLRSAQQLNVAHEKYWWIMPTSIIMGVFDVYIVAQIAKQGYSWQLVLMLGIGSGIGAMVATKLHSMARKKHGKMAAHGERR
jgi:hypothetical protein